VKAQVQLLEKCFHCPQGPPGILFLTLFKILGNNNAFQAPPDFLAAQDLEECAEAKVNPVCPDAMANPDSLEGFVRI
jgi:hypothetical protein